MSLSDSELRKHASKMFYSGLIPHYEFEDWLSVCMIARHKAALTFDPARKVNPKTWAWTVVRNECTNEVREVMGRCNGGKFDEVRRAVRSATPMMEIRDDALGGHNPHEFTLYVELFEKLHASMNDQERKVFDLCFVDEAKPRDVAAELHVSPGRVHQITRQIRDKAQAIAA